MRKVFNTGSGPVRGAGVILLVALLASCAAEAPPYRAQTPGAVNYGYADAKIDALHYSVLYTDSNEARAQNNLKLRAAQIAQAAGFSYFVLDVKGVARVRQTDTQFDLNQISNGSSTKGNNFAVPLNNYMGQNNSQSVKLYYSAAGRMTLLTPEQAQGNPGAIKVDQVLVQSAPAKS
jgi:hypothetical protein